MTIFALCHNIVFYVIGLSAVLIVSLPMLFLTYLPFSLSAIKTTYFSLGWLGSKLFLMAMLIPIHYKGLENIPATNQKAIFIANHQSTFDIFLMNKIIGRRPQVWLGWNRWWKYPVLGQIAAHSGIPVYFGDKPLGTSAVKSAVDRIKNGHSIVLFPEGQRFYDGKIHHFFTGFAAMAKLTGLPVVPVFIKGAGSVFPPKARLLQWGTITADVGQAFIFNKNETVPEFRDRVREWFRLQNELSKNMV